MSYCGICGDDDHTEGQCPLRLGAQFPDDSAGLLPQHKRCRTCREVSHAWDHMPCGQHSVPGAQMPVIDAPPVTPPRRVTHDLRALALEQVAQARAERGADLDEWWAAMLRREHALIRLPVYQGDDQPASADEPGQHQPADHEHQQAP